MCGTFRPPSVPKRKAKPRENPKDSERASICAAHLVNIMGIYQTLNPANPRNPLEIRSKRRDVGAVPDTRYRAAFYRQNPTPGGVEPRRSPALPNHDGVRRTFGQNLIL